MRDVSSWKRWTDLSRVIDESLADFNRAFAPNATNAIRRMERNFKGDDSLATLKEADTGSVKTSLALAVARVALPGIDIPGLVRRAPEEILLMHSSITRIAKDMSPIRPFSLVLEMIPEGCDTGPRYGDYNELGFSQALWLFKNQKDLPPFLPPRDRKCCIHFPATLGVRGETGSCFVPCLCLGPGEEFWKFYWHWTDANRGNATIYTAYGRNAQRSR